MCSRATKYAGNQNFLAQNSTFGGEANGRFIKGENFIDGSPNGKYCSVVNERRARAPQTQVRAGSRAHVVVPVTIIAFFTWMTASTGLGRQGSHDNRQGNESCQFISIPYISLFKIHSSITKQFERDQEHKLPARQRKQQKKDSQRKRKRKELRYSLLFYSTPVIPKAIG